MSSSLFKFFSLSVARERYTFHQFFYLLFYRYPDVTWRHNVKMREKEVRVTSTSGDPVTLRLLAESRTLVVSDKGNSCWVLNDFQNMCKNLSTGKLTDC